MVDQAETAAGRKKMGRDVAEEIFKGLCEDIFLDYEKFTATEKDEATKDRIVGALCSGQLVYADSVFTLRLNVPLQVGDKRIAHMKIREPNGVELRAMASVKKSNDDVGKGMAVLGAVTELGLPVINKMASRDLMVGVEVIGLFL